MSDEFQRDDMEIFFEPEIGPEPPEPCQYCSVIAGVLKECDHSCDNLTKERWIELTGETS